MIDTLVIATHNPGKLSEIDAMLAGFARDFVTSGSLGLPSPAETEETFRGNALIKARFAVKAAGLPALGDDSGLCVEALSGEPGIYTANWAETDRLDACGEPIRDYALGMRRVEDRLAGASNRRAYFNCTLALVWPDGREIIVDGRVDGVLVYPPRGANGFGFDPMFQPHGFGQTFGEMTPDQKRLLNHRVRAFVKLAAALA